MNTEYFPFKLVSFFLLVVFLTFFAACAPHSPKPPVGDTEPSARQYPDMERYKEKSYQSQVSLIKILAAEAEKFSWQGNHQDALFVYNQALAIADENETAELLESIEKTLEKSPGKDIDEFSAIKHLNIPKALLLYWMGVNYGLEENYVMSKKALEEFLLQFPNHKYAEDARELVGIISKSFFDKYTIGCLLPLSGKYAVYGERALSGIQMAAARMGEIYGREFNIVIKDTKADSEKAAEGVRELYRKNVAGIVGPLLAVQQAGEVAQELGIPMIALTQKSEFPLGRDFLFANFINPEMQVETLGTYLFGYLGVTRAAILYPKEKYGRTYMNLFWDMADKYGAKIVGVEAYDGKSTDFAKPIQKLTGEYFPLPDFLQPEDQDLPLDENMELVSEQPILNNAETENDEMPDADQEEKPKKEEKIEIDFEALFIPDSPSRVKLILPQLVFNDATGMYIVGTNLWHHESLLRDTRGYNRQAVITDGFFAQSQNLKTSEFANQYQFLFDSEPEFLEAVSYDTACILYKAAVENNVDSRQILKNNLLSGQIFEGATGRTFFDSEGAAHRELFLMTIKKGKFIEINR